MTNHKLRPWTGVVYRHSDVESGERSTAVYAIDLAAVVSGDHNMPAVYRDACDACCTRS
jgi:hypothetical protein